MENTAKQNAEAAQASPSDAQVIEAVVHAVKTAEPKALVTLRKLATDALNAHEKAVNAYFKLCVHIRDSQLDKATVQDVLTERGYPASRISEVKRVAFCTDELFSQFRQGVIGFRYTLAAARDAVKANGQQALPVGSHLTPEQKLKEELRDALSEIIPLKGALPKLLAYGVTLQVNGHAVTVKVKKLKPSTK